MASSISQQSPAIDAARHAYPVMHQVYLDIATAVSHNNSDQFALACTAGEAVAGERPIRFPAAHTNRECAI